MCISMAGLPTKGLYGMLCSGALLTPLFQSKPLDRQIANWMKEWADRKTHAHILKALTGRATTPLDH